MKKLIIFLSIVYFSPIFACDQPHEVVNGIKIGCPIEIKESYGDSISEEDLKLARFSNNKGHLKFFDESEIQTDKNDIVFAISFIKNYELNSSNYGAISKNIRADFTEFKNALERQWGKTVMVKGQILNIENPHIYLTSALIGNEDLVAIEGQELVVLLALSHKLYQAMTNHIEMKLTYITKDAFYAIEENNKLSTTKGF